MLSKNEFLILTIVEQSEQKLSQREISELLDVSLGVVNKNINTLKDNGYICNMIITDAGYAALEPYKVKRAVFIAAGFGSRMVPLTLNTPKPLIRVNGVRMIDTLLDAVTAIGIEEIYIVRGYLGEQFDVLKLKYPNIKFIENVKYNEANNILSAVCGKDFLSNAYVFEADLVLSNTKIISKYQYESNYLGIYKDVTDDWVFKSNKNSVISGLGIGGKDCYQMVGISYWNDADGKKLAEDIPSVYNSPGGKERYWDQVALEYCVSNYKVSVRPCSQDDIVEIDTFNELKAIDKTYDV